MTKYYCIWVNKFKAFQGSCHQLAVTPPFSIYRLFHLLCIQIISVNNFFGWTSKKLQMLHKFIYFSFWFHYNHLKIIVLLKHYFVFLRAFWLYKINFSCLYSKHVLNKFKYKISVYLSAKNSNQCMCANAELIFSKIIFFLHH